jgi:hypothetical protein
MKLNRTLCNVALFLAVAGIDERVSGKGEGR